MTFENERWLSIYLNDYPKIAWWIAESLTHIPRKSIWRMFQNDFRISIQISHCSRAWRTWLWSLYRVCYLMSTKWLVELILSQLNYFIQRIFLFSRRKSRKHNQDIWRFQNSHKITLVFCNSETSTVWFALSVCRVTGPYYFENLIVTGDS